MKTLTIIIIILLAAGLTSSQAQDTWTQKANFGGLGRSGAAGFSIGGKGYIGTGEDGSFYKKDFWQYDPVVNSWTQKADFSGTVRMGAVGFSIGSKGYLGIGYATNISYKDFWEYDPIANSWAQKADFGGTAQGGTASFIIGNKAYVGTGSNAGYTFEKDFWEYDPATDLWTQKANFGGTGRWGAVGLSIGSKGYIGLGLDLNYSNRNDFWEYDPSSNSWKQKADFGGTARVAATGFSIGNKGYVGIGSCLKDFWEFNPTDNTWTRKADFGGAERGGAVCFLIGNKSYIGTGFGCMFEHYNDFWEYTPECNGGLTVYLDADGDGYGDAANSLFVADCMVPNGFVLSSTDCNDNNPAINPSATEIVGDGIDNNCNGVIDEVVVCPIPVNLSAVNITGSAAKLKWDAVGGGTEGYKVRYKVANTSEWKIGTTYHNNKPISGLLPNTAYKWEVQTFCQITPNIMSEWSEKQEFTTGSLRMGDEETVLFDLYPNPAYKNFTIDLQLNSSADQLADIFLLNALGQIIYTSHEVANGELKKEITMPSSATQGWYSVRVVMSDQVIEKKLLYQK